MENGCKKMVYEYHGESDSVQMFLDDQIEYRPGEKIARKELYQLYEEYCFSNDLSPLSNRCFYKILRGKGFRECTGSQSIRYFCGMYSENTVSAVIAASKRKDNNGK